jgi:hypothetical protein
VADGFRGFRRSGRGLRRFADGQTADPISEGLSFVRWLVICESGHHGPSCQPDCDNDKQGLLPGPHVVIVLGRVLGLNSKPPFLNEPAN